MSLIKPTEVFGNRESVEKVSSEQFIFLLELYIYRIESERLCKLNKLFYVPTRIGIKFLNFTAEEDDEMCITAVDRQFSPLAGAGDADGVENFNCGRSIMFAIDRDSITDRRLQFNIDLSVKKCMPKSVKPDVQVGAGTLNMSKHFAGLRKELLAGVSGQPANFFEGSIGLEHEGAEIGYVDLYARISAFGESIVTEIESPPIGVDCASRHIFKSPRNLENEQLSYECRLISTTSIDNLRNGGKTTEKQNNFGPICGAATEAPIRAAEPDICPPIPIQSSRGPSSPCGKALVLKVSGLLDVENADGRGNQPIPDQESPEEAEHDVFVLRIGKKGLVGADEKSDIQLEMRTPKGPERRAPIRYETREMQTETEQPMRSAGKAAGKGKAAKGSKKKKK